MGRRRGQSWLNYIGNSIPLVKLFVKGENYQDTSQGHPDGGGLNLTKIGENIGYNLNNAQMGKPNFNAGNAILTGINAGSQIIGAAINAGAQRDVNEQQIAWAMQNYQLSRQDAIDFWNRENEYNHPSQQMARLKEAGLNPNLVYGSGAQAQGGSISQPQYQTPNLRAPQYGDAVTGVGNILATQMMQAQIEKTKAETRRIDVDQESQAFDLAVKNKVGYNRIAQQLNNRVLKESVQTQKEVREFDAWMEIAFGDQKNPSTDSSFIVDNFGSYFNDPNSPINRSILSGLESNEIINKAKKAGIDQTMQEIENLKKRAILYDDQHALNEIQIKLQDFSESLTKMGLNPTTVQFMQVIFSMLKSIVGGK